jgi:restriction endonuclease S subunit
MLPDGWQLYRFDQIAQNINERVLPADAEGLPYVGLEHLDSESLKIRRWGTPDEVEAQKLRFYPGDIIFGKRRFYQRKLAVAEVEGICSAHAMVLRAKEHVIDPVFLPFFMQSEMFFERAMAISVGSLSPTINWTALARQEFPLPPLDEQRRIAEILWAVEEAIENWLSSLDALLICRSRILAKGILKQGNEKTDNIADVVLDVQYGSSVAAFDDGQFPILRIPNVVNGKIDLSDLKWVNLPQTEHERYVLQTDDVLLVRTNGNPDYVGRAAVIDAHVPKDTVFASYLIRLKVNTERIRSHFLAEIINSPQFRRAIRGEIKSSAGNYNLNTKGIKRQVIIVPPLEAQDAILRQLDLLDRQYISVEENTTTLRQMKKRLFEAFIGET